MKQYTVKVFENRTEWYNSAEQLDRENGPAVEWTNGNKYWYKEGKLHREDGPAVEFANGEDGPVIEYAIGDKQWFKDGQWHREDGPAIERADGYKCWYFEGQEYNEAEFLKLISKTVTYDGKVVKIDGKKYSLILVNR